MDKESGFKKDTDCQNIPTNQEEHSIYVLC